MTKRVPSKREGHLKGTLQKNMDISTLLNPPVKPAFITATETLQI